MVQTYQKVFRPAQVLVPYQARLFWWKVTIPCAARRASSVLKASIRWFPRRPFRPKRWPMDFVSQSVIKTESKYLSTNFALGGSSHGLREQWGTSTNRCCNDKCYIGAIDNESLCIIILEAIVDMVLSQVASRQGLLGRLQGTRKWGIFGNRTNNPTANTSSSYRQTTAGLLQVDYLGKGLYFRLRLV